MNITQFIKSHKELNELPFLVVFRTIQILRDKNMIKGMEDNKNAVDAIQS